jgi:type I restriction enzyme S subunit
MSRVLQPHWDRVLLSNVTTRIGSGITPTGGHRVYKNDGRPFLRSQNIGWGRLLLEDIAYIDDATHESFSSTQIEPSDVFLNITGASIGRSAIANQQVSGGNVNQHVCIIRPDRSRLLPQFLNYFLLSRDGQDQIVRFQAGGNRQGLNFAQVRSIEVPLPCYSEQELIAATLSDVDSLIDSLDQAIAKKRDIKQAVMQELLTGRRRLPGFQGTWRRERLGEVAAIKTGKKNNDDKFEDGLYPFFVRSQHVERIDTYCFDGEAILVPGEGGIGTIIHYINGKFDYHQRVYKISNFREDMCGKFIYYVMNMTFNAHASRNSVKATVDSLRLPTFIAFEFLSPSKDEQISITDVLDDIDAELTTLEGRREKTNQLKQGMMQELLTGKTRLV